MSDSQARYTHAILSRAGYQIRNKRATCPYCEGRSKLTVAIAGDLFYCHRCQRGGSVRSLARVQGISLPPARLRKANIPKLQFRAWLSRNLSELGNEERGIARRALWAAVALSFFPDMEIAWTALAKWYHNRHRFEMFSQSASDRVGRYWMYRQWRNNAE